MVESSQAFGKKVSKGVVKGQHILHIRVCLQVLWSTTAYGKIPQVMSLQPSSSIGAEEKKFWGCEVGEKSELNRPL